LNSIHKILLGRKRLISTTTVTVTIVITMMVMITYIHTYIHMQR